MSVATLTTASPSLDGVEVLLRYFDANKVIPLEIEPVTTPAFRAELLESMREHGQLVPAFVCPSPDLASDERLCIEGNNRLWCARQLGIPLWSFDLGRFVEEAERIELTFRHNRIRRVMPRDELAAKAARYMELTHASAAEAALRLGVSGPTLSRAFGQKRIPSELRQRADGLGLSIRSLIAACPVALMDRAITFAETPMADGKKPTRDQVSAFIIHLKKGAASKGRKARPVTLRLNGRTVTVQLRDGDSVDSVVKDLTGIISRLNKHADVQPEGWSFLFQ